MNQTKQIRVTLEEIADVADDFEQAVISAYDFFNSPNCEIQRRGIGIKYDFREEIRRSDDWVEYLLKDDKAVGIIICRRTEFNNAEITMITTDERKFENG